MTDKTWNDASDPAVRTAVLNSRLDDARNLVPMNSCWRHKHGGLYQVTGYHIDTDNGEVRVHYHRVGGPGFDPVAEVQINFSRPIAEWTVDRFTFVD